MANLKFDKEITALLIIDPYNDFISEAGCRIPRAFQSLRYVILPVKRRAWSLLFGLRADSRPHTWSAEGAVRAG